MSVRSDLKLDLVDGAAVDEADVGVGGHRVGATRGHQLEAVQDSGEEEEQLVLGEALEVKFELLSLVCKALSQLRYLRVEFGLI